MVSAETPCAFAATVQVQGTIFLVDGQDEPNFESAVFHWLEYIPKFNILFMYRNSFHLEANRHFEHSDHTFGRVVADCGRILSKCRQEMDGVDPRKQQKVKSQWHVVQVMLKTTITTAKETAKKTK